MQTIQHPRLELYLTDCHFPTHDKKVWSLVLQVAKHFKPDLIWLNGDTLDCAQISRFRTDPRVKFTLKDDIDCAKARLTELRSVCSSARFYSRVGNHDYRLQNFIWDKAEQLSNLEELELPNLLDYKRHNIIHVPNEAKTRISSLWHLHGNEVKVGSSYPALKMLQRVNENVIFGHIHKFTVAHANSLSGKVREAWSIGCVQTTAVDYDFHVQWDQGFALIEYTPSGLFHVNPIIVFKDGGKKHVMCYGKLFTA